MLPEAGPWPRSGTRGSGLLDEKKPMWGREKGTNVGRGYQGGSGTAGREDGNKGNAQRLSAKLLLLFSF